MLKLILLFRTFDLLLVFIFVSSGKSKLVMAFANLMCSLDIFCDSKHGLNIECTNAQLVSIVSSHVVNSVALIN
jgi:hypothetical protein